MVKEIHACTVTFIDIMSDKPTILPIKEKKYSNCQTAALEQIENILAC
jgi:hypothetical protein